MAAEPGTGLRASPYKGLAHYEEEDARFFFGRERDREIISANLAARRLTLLYGESGVGKSSVLRAGVVHELRERARRNLAQGRPPQFVPVVFSSWRDDPVASLVAAVRGVVAELVGESDGASSGSRLDEALQASASAAGGELLLVLDQFEEYFLYHGEESGEDSFAEAFPRAVNRLDLRARFLVSIREDALAQLDRFKRRVPRLFENTLRISHLDLESARAAIERPIAEYAKLVEGGHPASIQPELVEAVLRQVQGQSAGPDQVADGGPPRIEAPYLQLVMTRLWDEEARRGSSTLRLGTLEELGGAEEIIRTHLDMTLGTLPPAEQDAAAAALRFLVTSSGTKIAHTVPDLSDFTGRKADELRPVLEKLATSERLILHRLTGAPGDPGGARYEISHDVLAGAILDWRRRHHADELERKRADAEQQARRERRKARLAAGAAAAFLLLAAFAVAVSIWAIHQKRVAQSERQLAQSRALLTAASDQLDKRLDRGIRLSLAAYHARPSAETRGALVTAVERSDRLRRIFAPTAPVRAVALSAAGSKFAVVTRRGAEVWDLSSGKHLGTVELPQAKVAAFAPDGSVLAVGGPGSVKLWDLARRRSVRTLTADVTALSFTDARHLTASTTSRVLVWDTRTGKELSGVTSLGAGSADFVAFSPDGKFLAFDEPLSGASVIGGDGRARFFRRYAGGSKIAGLAFAPSGHLLAIVTRAGRVIVANPAKRASFNTSVASRGQTPTSIALGPQPGMVAVGWDDGHIDAWRDIRARHGTATVLHGHGDAVLGLAFSEDGAQLASMAADGLAEVWTPWQSRFERRLADGTGDPLTDVAFASGAIAATGAAGAYIWPSLGSKPTRVKLPAGQAWVAYALSPDGRVLGASDQQAKVLLYDLKTSSAHLIHVPAQQDVTAFAVGPKGLFALRSRDGSVRIENTRGLRQVAHLGGGTAQAMRFDRDGTLLAAVTPKGVSLWNVEKDRLEGTPVTGAKVTGVAFSPTGRLLASGKADGSIDLWDVKGRRHAATISGGERTPLPLAFNPDSSTLAVSAGPAGSVFLWDVKSRQRLGAFEDPHGAVSSAAFNGDGRLLALTDGSASLTVLKSLLWDDVTGMQRRLCSVLGRAGTDCAH